MNDIAYYNLHVAKLLKISHLHVGKLQANRLTNPDVFSRIFQQTALLVYFVNLHDMTIPTSAKQELAVGGDDEITRMNTGQLITNLGQLPVFQIDRKNRDTVTFQTVRGI